MNTYEHVTKQSNYKGRTELILYGFVSVGCSTPLLLQIFSCLDDLNAAIAKSAEKLLIQRNASKRVERRQIGDIPSAIKVPTLFP